MSEPMSKLKIVFYIVLLLVITTGTFFYLSKTNNKKNNDQSIITRPVKSGEFTSFKCDQIKTDNLKENQVISSPLNFTGQIKGNWSFEGTFPIKITDKNNIVIANGVGQISGEWMTEKYVPFTSQIDFSVGSQVKEGKIIISKDNPSGLPENDDVVEIPVKF